MSKATFSSNGYSADAAIAFARSRPNTYLSELYDFLRIPSVSTRPEHVDDIKAAADWLATNMETAGLENIRIFPTTGHPLVYSDWLHAGDDKPTVLFYGHYDVQPADDLDLWKTPPFEPQVRKDNIYARGASDDKGQLLMLVKAVEALLRANGALPVNVKFIVEGEEESGGHGLKDFIPEHVDRLSADIAFISDTSMATWDQPAIVYGLRGMCSVNIDVVGPKLDVHSGVYGGGINNPINALVHILSQLIDADGHILIPGFYDDVLPLEAEERERINAFPFDEEAWLQRILVTESWGVPEYTTLERTGARPTLDVNGIIGGYTGDGAKTIIPSKAHAKVSMRLVPNQNPHDILEKISRYIETLSPPGVQVKLTPMGASPASIMDYHIPAMKAAEAACRAVFGRNPVYAREGGSIPIAGQIKRDLGIETILLGFGLPHDRIHAPNERFYLPNYYRGIETIIHFLVNYAGINARGPVAG